MFGLKLGPKLTLRDRLIDILFDFICIFENAVAICTLQFVVPDWTDWIHQLRKYE